MPNNNAKNPSKQSRNGRERHFCVELYPEWENCADILSDITSNALKYAYITHDKDVKDDGTPKKPHIHLYVYLKHGATLSAFAKRYNIEQRFVEVCINPKWSIRYLTHIDDPDKYQYERTDIYANIDLSFAYRTEKNEGECVLELLDYAITATKLQVIQYAVRENIYDVLRRNWTIIFSCKEEEVKQAYTDLQRIRFKSITRDDIGRIYDSEGREVIICKDGECYGEEIDI